jgi:hypothetical protein
MDFGEISHPAYAHVDPKKLAQKRHGSQPGGEFPGDSDLNVSSQNLADPAKAAKVFYDLAVMDDPPLRCVVGTDAYSMISKKVEVYSESIKEFEKWSNSTDVDGYKAPS